MKLSNLLATAAIALGLSVAVSGAASAAATTINYSGTIVDVPVLTTGLYDLSVFGAQGGNGVLRSGGLGASIDGKVSLTTSDVLHILVGQQGGSGALAGGGGGATYVFLGNTLLMVAGGGGGAGTLVNGQDGLATTNAGNATSVKRSAGGAGVSNNGLNGTVNVLGTATGGKSYTNGGAGGVGKASGGNGGFGGGGGASATAGGGGGGYNGGLGAALLSPGPGGDSYYNSSFITSATETAGVEHGNGLVTLNLLSAAPEPSEWALMMVGVGGMGAALRTRRRKTVSV